MPWPDEHWYARTNGTVVIDGEPVPLSTIACGELVAPVGRLVICDPFVALETSGNAYIAIPPGRYPVVVTIDDDQDAEAYASLLLSPAPEVTRRMLIPLREGEAPPTVGPDELVGFPVDAGTACFVDEGALTAGMPPNAGNTTWHATLFDNGRSDSWFSRMDDPEHIHTGVANIPLPLATDGSNIVLVHSGYGDGIYPIIGGYDAADNLVAIHIDFLLFETDAE